MDAAVGNDGDSTIEDVAEEIDGNVHPPVLVNESPMFLRQSYNYVVLTLQTYGWFLVLGIAVLVVIRRRLQPVINSHLKKREEEQDLHRYDSGVALSRQEAMEAARRKMQETHSAQAAIFAEEQRKKEEEKRKEKIADWERHQQGKGYKSKYRAPDTPEEPTVTSSRPKKKPVYRSSDYNPLTGEGGGGASFRSTGSRRGGASGGG